MLPVIIQFLTAKFESLPYLNTVFGLADFITVNEQKVVGVYSEGELLQMNFDTYASVIYLVKNGNVKRDTQEHPYISNLEQVTETYPLRAVIYSQGIENVNCSSQSQSIAQGIRKNLSGAQEDLEAAINAENVIIRIIDTELDKSNVWKSQTSLDNSLKDADILISIDFEITVTGDEQCFAGEPCEVGDFVFDYPAQSFCAKVAECDVEPQYLEAYGNGTNTIIKSELIGREVLSVTTDGRSRSRLKGEFTFNSITGETTFPSIIQTTQVIQWIYK